jgi:hypothetical protein
MSDRAKTPRPFDGAFVKEESAVRSRPEAPSSRSGTYAATPAASDPSEETIAERTVRIDNKMAIATTLLRGLSPLDARARLLSSAILRRDEVLLDAILSGMTDQVLELASDKRR